MDRLRLYQQDCLEQAKQGNIIAFLDTGTGKTNIAVHLILQTPGKSVFLAPVRNLVHQQFTVAYNAGIKALAIVGDQADYWDAEDWSRAYKNHQLLVMTPEIFKIQLSCGFLKLSDFALLILDECHHTKGKHPYSIIMNNFYHCLPYDERPKVLGLTASPITDNNIESANVINSIKEFCEVLDCRFARYNRESLAAVANKPKYVVVPIPTEQSHDPNYLTTALQALPQTQRARQAKDFILNHAKLLKKVGPRGFRIMLDEVSRKIGNEKVARVLQSLSFQSSSFSNRVEGLITVLSDHFRQQSHTQTIILAKERITVWYLSKCINEIIRERELPFRSERIVGRPDSKSLIVRMSEKDQYDIVDRFRNQEFNVLVATTVIEEGLDIPSCNLVIRFDGNSDNLRSYVQSKGRARDLNSHFMILCPDKKQKDTERKLRDFEACIMWLKDYVDTDFEQKRRPVSNFPSYDVVSTGAKVLLMDAEKFIEDLCIQLSKDRNTRYHPKYNIYKQKPGYITKNGDKAVYGGYEARLKLPTGLLAEVVWSRGCYQSDKDAKADAAMEAIKKMHETGRIDNHLKATWLEKNQKKKNYRNVIDNEHIFDLNDVDGTHNDKALMFKQEINIEHMTFSLDSVCYIYEVITAPVYPPSKKHSIGLLTTFPISEDYKFKGYPLNLFKYRGVNLKHSHKERVLNCPLCEKLPVIFSFALREQRVLPYSELVGINKFHCFVYSILKTAVKEFYDEISDQVEGVSTRLVPVKNGLVNWKIIQKTCDFIDKDRNNQVQPIINNPVGKSVRAIHNNEIYLILSVKENGLDYEFEEWKDSQFKIWSVREYFAKKYNFVSQSATVYQCYSLKSFRNMLKPKVASFHIRQEELFLPVELCVALPIPSEILLWAKLSPNFYYKVNQFFLINHLLDSLSLPLTFDIAGEALIAQSAMEAVSYERLEKLGDSVLKFLVSDFVFNKYPEDAESQLTDKRRRQISNENLFEIAINLKLFNYIQVKCFNHKSWTPPGMPEEENRSSNTVKISIKQLADLIESILGATYHQSGFDLSNELLRNLRIIEEYEPLHSQRGNDCGVNALGYTFQNPGWLTEALTHISAEKDFSYERLEFLGDALLDIVIVKFMFEQYPEADPGLLTILHHECVKNSFLAVVALDWGLIEKMKHTSHFIRKLHTEFSKLREKVRGDPEEHHKIPEDKFKVFGDIFESVIGAIYMDCRNFEVVEQVILNCFNVYLSQVVTANTVKKHPINRIQNWAQVRRVHKMRLEPGKIDTGSGQLFVMKVFSGDSVLAEGKGSSKYEASLNAAKKLFEKYPEPEK